MPALRETFLRVGDLAQLLILPPLVFVIRRMVARRSPVPRIHIVAKINFQPQTASKWNHLVKCFVISNKPWSHRQRHRQHRTHSRSQPLAATSCSKTIPSPRVPRTGAIRHHPRRIGQSSNPLRRQRNPPNARYRRRTLPRCSAN